MLENVHVWQDMDFSVWPRNNRTGKPLLRRGWKKREWASPNLKSCIRIGTSESDSQSVLLHRGPDETKRTTKKRPDLWSGKMTPKFCIIIRHQPLMHCPLSIVLPINAFQCSRIYRILGFSTLRLLPKNKSALKRIHFQSVKDRPVEQDVSWWAAALFRTMKEEHEAMYR